MEQFHTDNRDLQLAIHAAEQASAFIKTQFSGRVDSIQKSDQSLVTVVDQKAEKMIRDILKDTDHGFIGEESTSSAGSSGANWVIDPIDGTTNFYRKQTPFAVSIALMQDSVSLLGVIQNPLTGDCYYAQQGTGAFRNEEQIHVSGNMVPGKSIVFFNYGSDAADRQRISNVVQSLIYEFDLRIWGTTAWEMCAVANGTADAFVCVGDELWDFAAAICIVQEAGGVFSDWQGKPWDTGQSYILAAQPAIQPLILEKIAHLQQASPE